MAQRTAGDVCVGLQAPPPKAATQVSGGRDGPRRIDGDARTKHRVRARTPRRSHCSEVASGVSIPHQAQNRYAASDASSVHNRGNLTTLLGLSKNPALAFRVDTGPRLAGCLPTGHLDDGQPGLHRLEGGELRSRRRPLLLFGVLQRQRSRETHCALLHPNRLDGAHEAGLIFVLYRVRRPGSLRLAQSTRLADALAFIARDGQPGASYLHNLKTDHRAVAIRAQGRNGWKRGGLSRSARRHGAPRGPARTPVKRPKRGSLNSPGPAALWAPCPTPYSPHAALTLADDAAPDPGRQPEEPQKRWAPNSTGIKSGFVVTNPIGRGNLARAETRERQLAGQ